MLDGWILLVEDMEAPMSRLERNWRHLERLGVCSHTHPMLTLAQGAEVTLVAGREEVQVEVHGPWVQAR